MTDDEDDALEQQLDELLERAVKRFRAARGSDAKLRVAIERYLEEGDALDRSPLELRDYFDISSPGLVEQAGYAADELTHAIELFDSVSEARYG